MAQNRFERDRPAAVKPARLSSLLVPLLLCAVLAACQDGVLKPAQPLRTAQNSYPIMVEPRIETLALSSDPIHFGIGDANAARIGAFASNYMRHGHGPLIIESATVKISKQTFEQIKAINAIMAERGVPVARLEWRTAKIPPPAPAAAGAPGEAAKQAANPLVLSYTRYLASSPPCGDWSRDIGSSHDNQPPANFGCATQHNLAVMVSDPLDLKQPRGIDASDAVRRAVVMDKYRKGEATASPRSQDEKGTVSEVAQ